MAKTRKPTVRKPKKPAMSFNERVRKVIKGEAETKEKIVNVFNESLVRGIGMQDASYGLTQPNLLETLAIAQGTEEEQREGNKIENCKLKIRGVIVSKNSTPTNPNTNPFEVHMVAYKLKNNIANDTGTLKSLPNNLTGPVDGTLINTTYPYNKDKYIFRKIKVFRLKPLHSNLDAGSATDLQNVLNPQSSTAPMFHRFNEVLDIHKDLKFNDGSTTPANDWCGISFFTINGDGTNALGPNPTEVRASVTMDAILTYKDL